MTGALTDPRKEFGKAVTELAQKDERIVVFSADSGKSSGFGGFIEQYPDRYYECGIMEQGRNRDGGRNGCVRKNTGILRDRAFCHLQAL